MTAKRDASVDIIVTGHNLGKWIGDTLASVYAQTRRDFTLTVVDNASTDDSVSVIERCLRQAPDYIERKFLRMENVGPSRARDEAIKTVSSPYFMFIDGDDMIAPTSIERHVPIMNRRLMVGFSYSDRLVFGEVNHLSREKLFDLNTLKHRNWISGGGALVRREAYDEVGGFRQDNWGYGEDWELWLDIAEAGWKWHHIAEPLVHYRHHISNSLSFYTVGRFRPAINALRHIHHPRIYSTEELRQARKILKTMPKDWNLRKPYIMVEECQEGLLANPGNTHLLFLLALAYIRQGEFQNALNQINEIRRIAPSDNQAMIVSLVLQSVKTKETVCLGYKRLFMQDALCRLLLLYHDGIRIQVPAKAIHAAAKIKPRAFLIDIFIVNYWEDRVKKMRRDAALRFLDNTSGLDAMTLNAHRAELHFLHNTASFYKAEGDIDKATAIFNRLLETLLKIGKHTKSFDNEIGSAYFHLAGISFEVGKLKEAQQLFEICSKYIPKHRMAAQYLKKIQKAQARKNR